MSSSHRDTSGPILGDREVRVKTEEEKRMKHGMSSPVPEQLGSTRMYSTSGKSAGISVRKSAFITSTMLASAQPFLTYS